MAVNEEPEDGRVPQRMRGRVTAYVNIGLCVIGAVFIVIGVLRSTLLLYVGCAFIGAAIGGFIRSRLPIHQMHMVPPHLHMVYRHELQRNIQAALQDGVQTFLVVNGQRPMGVDQKTIEKHSCLTTYKPLFTATMHPSESVDRISVISSFTDSDEPSCIICLLSFKKGQQLRQLKCQHLFHVDCIDKWLKINRLCPTCRIDLTGSNAEKPAGSIHSNSPHPSTSIPMPVSAHLDIEGDDVVGSSGISIVINTLEDITRNQEDTTEREEAPNDNTAGSPPSFESVTEQNSYDEHACEPSGSGDCTCPVAGNNGHVCASSSHADGPCSTSSCQCDPVDSDGDQDQYHSAEDLPSVSSVVDNRSNDQAHESSSTPCPPTTVATTCAMEVKSTMITLSMPQNATPWV